MSCPYLHMLQEREGKKDMEPRSEDGQFQDVTIQQVPPNPVSDMHVEQT